MTKGKISILLFLGIVTVKAKHDFSKLAYSTGKKMLIIASKRKNFFGGGTLPSHSGLIIVFMNRFKLASYYPYLTLKLLQIPCRTPFSK